MGGSWESARAFGSPPGPRGRRNAPVLDVFAPAVGTVIDFIRPGVAAGTGCGKGESELRHPGECGRPRFHLRPGLFTGRGGTDRPLRGGRTNGPSKGAPRLSA